ncbi:MAG: GDP-mannose 4,6-dehydratase [Holophagaceae bacterium]|nr:GDP-mannose 4,6-dehydratase [Holophagaceae bacterium]
MRVLVTGGAGFIGSHFADDLVAEGHEVLVLDNLAHGRENQVPTAARFERLDLGSPKLEALVAAYRPDWVYHFAAQIDVRRSFEEVLVDADQNILGSLRLLEACRVHGVKHFWFASSGGAIYGDPGICEVHEAALPRPASPYGVAKLAMEGYLAAFQQRYGLSSTSLRFSNVYGPRQDSEGEAGVVARFISVLRAGGPACIFGTGRQTRDFIFVGDLVKAGRLLRSRPVQGPLNLGSGEETSVLDLHGAVQNALGLTCAPRFLPARDGEQQRSLLDCTKARQCLGWQASTGLKEGLQATLAWFQGRPG